MVDVGVVVGVAPVAAVVVVVADVAFASVSLLWFVRSKPAHVHT